jgi:hypothetical protein
MENILTMNLQQIKTATGKSWAELSADSGVVRSMLFDVGQGWKWPGPETALGIQKLGVSLDDQAKFYSSRAEARAERLRLRAASARERDCSEMVAT